MSISFFLRSSETKKAAHVAEQSSSWFRGADYPQAAAAFAVSHDGKELYVVDADHFDDFIEFDVWTLENFSAQYSALVGHPLVGL
jgi:hypothetical protein